MYTRINKENYIHTSFNTIRLAKHTAGIDITLTMYQDDATVFNLTGYTASIQLKNIINSAVKSMNTVALVAPNTSGQIKWSVKAVDMADAGVYEVEVELIKTNTDIIVSAGVLTIVEDIV